MARTCDVCGRGPVVGNRRSHSNIATKRVFSPNVQPVRALVDGVPRRIHACTRCLRSGKVKRAV